MSSPVNFQPGNRVAVVSGSNNGTTSVRMGKYVGYNSPNTVAVKIGPRHTLFVNPSNLRRVDDTTVKTALGNKYNAAVVASGGTRRRSRNNRKTRKSTRRRH